MKFVYVVRTSGWGTKALIPKAVALDEKNGYLKNGRIRIYAEFNYYVMPYGCGDGNQIPIQPELSWCSL